MCALGSGGDAAERWQEGAGDSLLEAVSGGEPDTWSKGRSLRKTLKGEERDFSRSGESLKSGAFSELFWGILGTGGVVRQAGGRDRRAP